MPLYHCPTKSGVQCFGPKAIATGITQAKAAGRHHNVELLRLALADRLDLVVLGRDGIMSDQVLKYARSAVAVAGDRNSTGPSDWAGWPHLAGWAAVAVIHAAGASAAIYRQVAMMAASHGHCLLIECEPSAAGAWVATLQDRGVPTYLIKPPTGRHATAPDRGAIQ
jgi:hypothetical protein